MKAIRAINNCLEKWLCTAFYLMIFVVIVMEVIQRFIISFSSSWGEEVARYSFIYLIWISISMCIKDRIHLRIDFLLKFFPNNGKSVIRLIEEIFTILIGVTCIYLSFKSVSLSFKYESVTDGLRVIKGIFLFAIPFGLSLMLIRNVQNIIIDIKNIINHRESFDGNPIF